MSRYRGPRLKIVHRLGSLNGLTKAEPPSSEDSSNGSNAKKKKLAPYSQRLLEKQKLRYNYGLSEKQLLNYVKEARKTKGSTGFLLLQMLEMRLDTIVFRFGLANTIPAARQLVNHGHLLVNGKKVNIPSFRCNPNDTISLRKKNLKKQKKQFLIINCPEHLEVNLKTEIGVVKTLPDKKNMTILIDELLIVEYYSRK